MTLSRHYCPAPICASSRGSLLTGRHQGHCAVRNTQFDKELPNEYTLGSVLQKAGYAPDAERFIRREYRKGWKLS